MGTIKTVKVADAVTRTQALQVIERQEKNWL